MDGFTLSASNFAGVIPFHNHTFIPHIFFTQLTPSSRAFTALGLASSSTFETGRATQAGIP
jgi:hypothetical protein